MERIILRIKEIKNLGIELHESSWDDDGNLMNSGKSHELVRSFIIAFSLPLSKRNWLKKACTRFPFIILDMFFFCQHRSGENVIISRKQIRLISITRVKRKVQRVKTSSKNHFFSPGAFQQRLLSRTFGTSHWNIIISPFVKANVAVYGAYR